MGLFSKKKTYRDLSYTRVIDDAYLPDVIGQAITKYILDTSNTKSLTDLMLEYGWESNAVKWNAAYRYALKAGKYTYSVPTVGVITETDFTNSGTLEDVLEELTGNTNLTYVYSKFGSINFRHAMWQLLVSNYNYSATTNILGTLTTQLGVTAYLNNATNYITTENNAAADTFSLEHWGFSPKWGTTPTRDEDVSAEDTADQVSSTGSNYVAVEYAFRSTGATTTTTVSTTTVTTVTKTPNAEGGYDETTTTDSSDQTTTEKTTGNATMPASDTIISQTNGTATTATSQVTHDPSTTTTTDPDTGVITEVTTQIVDNITVDTYDIDVIAGFDMGFGQYDFTAGDEDIDTTTVLDAADSGNYDPDASLVPSGESTADGSDYFQVMYYYSDSSGNYHYLYFTYAYGSGNYPSLDGITDSTVEDFGSLFPRIYFRLNGNKLIDDQYADTDAYKTSVKLCKKLDIDWLDVGAEIYDSLSSLSKVRDVYIVEAIPAITENQLEMEYLFKYFNTVYGIRNEFEDSDYTTQIVQVPTGTSTRPENTEYDLYNAHKGATITAKDTSTEMANSFDAVGLRTVTGSIGAVGTYSTSNGNAQKLMIYSQYYKEETGTGAPVTYIDRYGYETVAYISYCYQDTETTYQEIRVYALANRVKVGGGYVTKSGTDENLMVPLDYAFRKEFSTHDAETLYSRATQLFIGTEYTVKTKWYQTGLFQAVMVVVSVAISWATGGASLSLIGVVTAAATAVGAMVIFSLLSKYVFSKLGSWFTWIAVVVAVVAIAYGAYLFTTSTTGPFSITAKQMMMASNYAFKAAQSSQQGQLAAIQQEMKDFAEQAQEQQDELDAANEELFGGSNDISDSTLSSVAAGYIFFGDSMDNVISRTLNTNIGAELLTLPQDYLTNTTNIPSNVEVMAKVIQNMQKRADSDLNDLDNTEDA